MASRRPTAIFEYIRAAPHEGERHLRRLFAILKSVGHEAEEAIKWGRCLFPPGSNDHSCAKRLSTQSSVN